MTLSDAIAAAVKKVGFEDSFSIALKIAEPKYGDLQLNGALAYAKAHGMNSREVAQKLVDALEIDKSQITTTIAGAGFINFSYTPKALAEAVKEFKKAEDLSPRTRLKENVVVEYGSPNVGKQMHIGNFRSYKIGEAIARIIEFCGSKVHRDSHPGDWGTTFGYLIWAIKKDPHALPENDPNPLAAIDRLYKETNAKAGNDPKIMSEVRAELAKLQSGDSENHHLWEKIVKLTLKSAAEFEALFGIHYDTVLGESFYNDKFDQVYEELQETGLAKIDQGALCVFHPEHPRFKTQPEIVRKSDGAGNYVTSDLATMLHRVKEFKADAIYIVVDFRQSDHFEQLYLTTKKWFAAKGYHVPRFQHVSFGTILGEDNKPLKTRSGESVKLRDVLNEATERARKIVEEKNPTLPENEKKNIAEVVGIGTLRYADLSQNRTSDYQFNWDKLLSFEGNTAPYLLYAVARIHSLFEKLGRKTTEEFGSVETLTSEAEIALARKLIQAPHHIALAAADLRSHYLATYLYELTGLFSHFYNSDPIKDQPADIQNRRLLLAQKTLLALETGLHLLGLKTVRRM